MGQGFKVLELRIWGLVWECGQWTVPWRDGHLHFRFEIGPQHGLQQASR